LCGSLPKAPEVLRSAGCFTPSVTSQDLLSCEEPERHGVTDPEVPRSASFSQDLGTTSMAKPLVWFLNQRLKKIEINQKVYHNGPVGASGLIQSYL